MSIPPRSQPPEAPKPASGDPTRPVPNAGRAASPSWDAEVDLVIDIDEPHAPLEPPTHTTTRPMGELEPAPAAITVQPGRRPALQRHSTDSGLGAGVPGPSFGGDTDFDTTDEHPSLALRQTTSYESRSKQRIATLSEPPEMSLGFGADEGEPESEALDLVGRYAPSLGPPDEPPRVADPLSELRERYALGDFSGALTIAESLLEDDRGNADVQRYAESCRDVLKQMYMARLGALDQIPLVAVPAEQLRWLTLDHRAGFLLSHVDGVSTLEEILDISGMPHLEAMRIIYELLQQRVILLQ